MRESVCPVEETVSLGAERANGENEEGCGRFEGEILRREGKDDPIGTHMGVSKNVWKNGVCHRLVLVRNSRILVGYCYMTGPSVSLQLAYIDQSYGK